MVEGGGLKTHPLTNWIIGNMARPKAIVVATASRLLLGATVLAPAAEAAPRSASEAAMLNTQSRAQNVEFATKDEAEAFLIGALPKATASNPKYRAADGGLTQWLTREVIFGPGASPSGVGVEMKEDVLQFRGGRQTSKGAHEVRFLIEDVQISELADGADVTESGEKALGIIFRCNSGKCIEAKWDGVPSPSDWSDISIQDPALRAKILAAFQALKRFAGNRAG